MAVLQSLPLAMGSAAVFAALCLMRDRKLGASVAQAVIAVAGLCLLVAIARDNPALGVDPATFANFATSLMAAAIAGMFYHLYLGRFDRVWTARGVFALVFLALAAVLGVLFGALIG